MIDPEAIVDNEFLRQFEFTQDEQLATIEYSQQDRKIFLTKLTIPEAIASDEFEYEFIKVILDRIKENESLSVMPTHPSIVKFIRKNRLYKSMLPVGVRI
ncbi:N-acetyltransferase [Aurantibacter sp.]|uniref:N-acetyltransferase n=1 Tax=Aurantibacter sp. TaxID=2807103 RepID=UPI0035C83762